MPRLSPPARARPAAHAGGAPGCPRPGPLLRSASAGSRIVLPPGPGFASGRLRAAAAPGRPPGKIAGRRTEGGAARGGRPRAGGTGRRGPAPGRPAKLWSPAPPAPPHSRARARGMPDCPHRRSERRRLQPPGKATHERIGAPRDAAPRPAGPQIVVRSFLRPRVKAKRAFGGVALPR